MIRESSVGLHCVAGPAWREQWPEPLVLMSSWLTKTPRKAKTRGLSLQGLHMPRWLGWHPLGCCDLGESRVGQSFSLQSRPFVFVWVSVFKAMLPEPPLPSWDTTDAVTSAHFRCPPCVVMWRAPNNWFWQNRSPLNTVRNCDSYERAATQPELSDPAIKSCQLRLLTQQRVT